MKQNVSYISLLRVDNELIKEVNEFVYLGGRVIEDGGSEEDTPRTAQLEQTRLLQY